MSQIYQTEQPIRIPSPVYAAHLTAEPEGSFGGSISSFPFSPRRNSGYYPPHIASQPEGHNNPHGRNSEEYHYPTLRSSGDCNYSPHNNAGDYGSPPRSVSDIPFPIDYGSRTDVDSLEKGHKSLEHHAQEYKLPLTVKAVADSYIQIASTMALITALLAAVQISMAQIVFSSPTNNSQSPAWLILHWLVYAGIYLNSGATASALAFINYTGYLTSSARVLLLTDPTSWPYRIFHGEKLPFEYLSLPYLDQDFDLMINFGLKRNMRPMWRALSYGFYAGSGFSFVSLGVWIWLNEPLAVAASLSILILPPAAWLTSSFFFTAEHVPSVPKDLAKNLAFCACTVIKCDWDPQPVNVPVNVPGKQIYA